MTKRVWLLLTAVGALALLAAGVAQAGGPPAGEGANGCYQLTAGTSIANAGAAVDLVSNAKYNVGNPASVLIAGDCNGGPIGTVDDGLTVTVSSPNGKSGGTLHQNFFDRCGGSNNGGSALDVTSLFKPGTNTISLSLTNDCGGAVSTPALYLVVSQH